MGECDQLLIEQSAQVGIDCVSCAMLDARKASLQIIQRGHAAFLSRLWEGLRSSCAFEALALPLCCVTVYLAYGRWRSTARRDDVTA